MQKNQLVSYYSRMNSNALLAKAISGGMNKKNATAIAIVLDRRFPKPAK